MHKERRMGWIAAIGIGSLAFGSAALAQDTTGDTDIKRDQQMQKDHTWKQGDQSGQWKGDDTDKGQLGVQKGQQGIDQSAQAGCPEGGEGCYNAIRLTSLNTEQITSLQQNLKTMGLYKGEVDGKFGPMTRAALSQFFQRQAQLIGQGLLQDEAVAVFGLDTSAVERVPVRGMEPVGGQKEEQEKQYQQQQQKDVEDQKGTQGQQGQQGQQYPQGQYDQGQQGIQQGQQGQQYPQGQLDDKDTDDKSIDVPDTSIDTPNP